MIATRATIEAVTRARILVLAVTVALACGDDDAGSGGGADASAGGDAGASIDAGDIPTETRVTGTMAGTEFTMSFALIEWDQPSFPILCLSSREFSDPIPDCNAHDDTRYLFVSRIDMEGMAVRLGQVDRVEQSSTVDSMLCLDEGPLVVYEFDPDSERVALAFQIGCDDGPLSGSVVIP